MPAVAGGSHFPPPSGGRHRQYASRRILHRQAVLARHVDRPSGAARTARLRDAAARAHEPDAATAGARLIAWFWKQPYTRPPVAWGTQLHDQFMLPHFVQRDFREVLDDLNARRLRLRAGVVRAALRVSLSGSRPRELHGDRPRTAPGHRALVRAGRRAGGGRHGALRGFFGGAPAGRRRAGYTATVTWSPAMDGGCRCTPPAREGEWVAGVRYRAWQPPSCLHPTISGAFAAGLRHRRHVDRPFDGRLHLSRGASRRAEL